MMGGEEDCAFVGDSVAGRLAGVAVIGFANRPGQGRRPGTRWRRRCDYPAQRNQRSTAHSTTAL
jgi:hypothetical protein